MTFNATEFIIELIVSTIILSPVLWIAGRVMVSKEKAKFTDAIWIAVLGIILRTIIVMALLPNIAWLATIVVAIVWLLLIRHFFDTGWIKGIFITIIAIVILMLLISTMVFWISLFSF